MATDRIEERRVLGAAELLVITRGAGGRRDTITGFAAVFNSRSRDLGRFTEIVAPGAFARSIRERADVVANVNHDENRVLGRTRAGTLRLAETPKGLAVEIDPPATTYAGDIIESVRRGDVDQMSFAFVAREDSWANVDGGLVRTLLDVDLRDVSIVTSPAYLETEVTIDSRAVEYGRVAAEKTAWRGRIAVARAAAMQSARLDPE